MAKTKNEQNATKNILQSYNQSVGEAMNFHCHYTHPLSLCKNNGHGPIPESWRIHRWSFQKFGWHKVNCQHSWLVSIVSGQHRQVYQNERDVRVSNQRLQVLVCALATSCSWNLVYLLSTVCPFEVHHRSPLPTHSLSSPLCCMVATLWTILLALLSTNQSVLLTSGCVMSYCPVPNQSVHPKLLSELQHANIMDTAIVQAVEEGQES